jgi:hypothetical protein
MTFVSALKLSPSLYPFAQPAPLFPVCVAANENAPQSFYAFAPLKTVYGVLPNGEALHWGLLSIEDIADMLALQDAVALAATEAEKRFLIKRDATDYSASMRLGHLYWGARANGVLIAAFGMAENDEEIGDGRGEVTPLSVLGVEQHDHVDILKAAQVHPAYRDQGLASLAALTRYMHFLSNPDKQVLMTKVHSANQKVITNYTKNGFTPVFHCTVNDRGETFDLVTLMATREVIQSFLAKKSTLIKKQLNLQTSWTIL